MVVCSSLIHTSTGTTSPSLAAVVTHPTSMGSFRSMYPIFPGRRPNAIGSAGRIVSSPARPPARVAPASATRARIVRT